MTTMNLIRREGEEGEKQRETVTADSMLTDEIYAGLGCWL